MCKCIAKTARSVAEPQTVPFQAAIQGLDDPIPVCEGAQISPNYVLTSDLCLIGVPNGMDLATFPFRIALGVYDYSVTEDAKMSFIIKTRVESSNNFALLKLAKLAKTSKNINYVCLPSTVAIKVCVYCVYIIVFLILAQYSHTYKLFEAELPRLLFIQYYSLDCADKRQIVNWHFS